MATSTAPDLSGQSGGLDPEGAATTAWGGDFTGVERYRREGRLALGGMGEVYVAWDRKLARHVAIKEARSHAESAARLIAEAHYTAALDHPMIVAVHDTGTTADGRPFYAMRLVRGRAMSEALCGANREDRLRLLKHVLDACHAVAYAHTHGVLHRDLKPANVMIGEFGETQVVDWGLGTRRGAALTPVELGVTCDGAVLGTPAYISPEQARGERADVRSDVWGLGAILYEVITGCAPHSADDASAAMLHARDGAVIPAAERAPAMPRELCAIADRALQADPTRRYHDAAELAGEVARYLAGDRVVAHAYSPWELLVRAVRAWKRPLVVAAAAAVVVLVLAAVGGLRLAAETRRAVAAEADARASLVVADANLRRAVAAEADALANLRVADANRRRSFVAQAIHAAAEERWPVAEVFAADALIGGDDPEARGLLVAADALARPTRVARFAVPDCIARDFTADGVVCGGDTLSRWIGDRLVWQLPLRAAALQVDSSWVVARTSNGLALVDLATGDLRSELKSVSARFVAAGGWLVPRISGAASTSLELASGRVVEIPDDCRGEPVALLTLGADPLRRVALCGDGTLTVGAPDGADRRRWTTDLHDPGGALSMRLAPDASRVAVGMVRGALAIVDLTTGATRRADSAHGGVADVVWAPDAKDVAVLRDRGTVEIWGADGPRLIGHVPILDGVRVAFAPDGVLRILDRNSETRWRWTAPPAPAVLRDEHGLSALAFSPDGTRLATAHGGGRTVVWDLGRAAPALALATGEAAVKAVAWSPDGSALYTAAAHEEGARVHDANTGALRGKIGPDRKLRRLLAMADGRLIAVGMTSQLTALWTIDGAGVTRDVTGCPLVDWIDAAASPDRRRAALVGSEGQIAWFVDDLCTATVPGLGANAAAIADDGWVAATTPDALLRVEHGSVVWTTPVFGASDVAVSPDARLVAAGLRDHTARILDARDGRVLAVLGGHDERVAAVAFSPDGALLATASWDRSVRLWPRRRLDEPAAAIHAQLHAAGYPTVDQLLR